MIRRLKREWAVKKKMKVDNISFRERDIITSRTCVVKAPMVIIILKGILGCSNYRTSKRYTIPEHCIAQQAAQVHNSTRQQVQVHASALTHLKCSAAQELGGCQPSNLKWTCLFSPPNF